MNRPSNFVERAVEMLPRIAEEQQRAREQAWRLEYFSDIKPVMSVGGLVSGLLSHDTFSLIVGPSGSRKTFLATDLALSISRGEPWFGRATNPTPVIYIAAEAGKSYRNRIVAYRQHYGLKDATVQFACSTAVPNLGELDGDVEKVIDLILAASEKLDGPPGMLFIDTAARVMPGSEEGPRDMGALVRNVDKIRSQTGAHVCVVHHMGKDKTKGARGSTVLPAAADTILEVVADDVSKTSTATVVKQRDLEIVKPFTFGLTTVEVGVAEDDRIVTSCVVTPAEAPAKRTSDRLTVKQSRMFAIIKAAGKNGLTQDEWNATARADGLGAKRRSDLKEVRAALAQKGLVDQKEGRWFAKH